MANYPSAHARANLIISNEFSHLDVSFAAEKYYAVAKLLVGTSIRAQQGPLRGGEI